MSAYEGRVVNYETVHGVGEGDFDALMDALHTTAECTVLEGCVGYGAVAHRLLRRCPDVRLSAYDFSSLQLVRLLQEVPELTQLAQMDMRHLGYGPDIFDRYVIKAGLQEVGLKDQVSVFSEAFRVLRPGGSFVIWQPTAPLGAREVFTRILRKKDELAGFWSMVENRYWNVLEEWEELFREAGFEGVEVCHESQFVLMAQNRASELVSRERLQGVDEVELGKISQERVSEFVQYVRSLMTPELVRLLKYEDRGDDFRLSMPNLVIRGHKR